MNTKLINSIAAATLLFPALAHSQLVSVQFPPYYSQPYSTLNGNSGQGTSGALTAGVVSDSNWNDALGTEAPVTPDSFGTAVDPTEGGDGVVYSDITNANLFTWVTNPAPTSAYPNNGSYTGSAATLVTSTGAPSVLQFDLSGANYERGGNGNGNGFTTGQGNKNLANGGAFNTGSGGVSLSLAGLNATDYYTLYAYVDADYNFYGNGVIQASLGNQSLFFTMNGASTLTGFTAANGTTAGDANLADYAAFTVSGATLNADSLNIAALSGGGVGLDGFQLVDIGATPPAVPEPSTVWMFSLGFLGLMVHVYRKRAVRI